jgi:predicted transglutaminase-like cysteine proteinase
MHLRHSQLLVLAIFSLLFLAKQSAASGTYMELIGKGFGPPAFNSFCRQMGRLCDTTSGATFVQLTADRKAQLLAVNAEVNSKISERSDLETTGLEDQWSLPERDGDCEDFAILKKSELMKRGWPAASLLLTVVRPRFGKEGHVVLTARTSEGDLILDSLAGSVKDWSKTSYRYYARQSQKASGWERIGRAIPIKTVRKMQATGS